MTYFITRFIYYLHTDKIKLNVFSYKEVITCLEKLEVNLVILQIKKRKLTICNNVI